MRGIESSTMAIPLCMQGIRNIDIDRMSRINLFLELIIDLYPLRSVTPRVGRLSEVSDPPLQRQHTLPPYEAVVMADADPSWKSSNPESPGTGELPPKYESLFPDGPPIPTNYLASAPTVENTQQERSPHAANTPGEES